MRVSLQNYWGCVNKNLRLMRILCLFLLIMLPNVSFTAPQEGVLEELIARASQMKLDEDKAWLNLLHYKSTLPGVRKSQVDDADFFLANNGAIDSQAELEASLRGFFSFKTSAHPRCLFPARMYWLNSKLNFITKLPPMECPLFKSWKDKFQAVQVTLLFPSMYLNNPASMFGHTFLRFDRADKNHLLSYTLSYSASYDESDSLMVYSWKGVTGGYQGNFFIRAYFEELQKYNDIEQRDIWEYQLNLNQQEIDQLLRHVWEVRGTDFDYFFLRENCSYRLLALLDVAREGLNMSIDSHPLYAVPVDTVRDIKNAGLINAHFYRPSKHNEITQMIAQLDEPLTRVAISIVDDSENKISIQDKIQNFTVKQQSKILLLASDLLNLSKELSPDKEVLQLGILSARSNLPVSKQETEFYFNAIPPELSHQSARWSVSLGQKKASELSSQKFYEIGIRPVFHDLLDVSKGFTEGVSVSILEMQLRWYQ